MLPAEALPRIYRVAEEIEKVIVGKRAVVETALVALLAQGHLLIEDVPGTGKTMLARSIARCIDGSFRRIQFTPDLLPADVTGTSIYNQKTGEFEFHAGPILNNVEYQGTFPLPESQLDRFVMRLSMGYPSPADEAVILRLQSGEHPIHSIRPVITAEEVEELRRLMREVRVADPAREYIVDLVTATRECSQLALGASLRGSLDLLHCAQAQAALRGRNHVLPDDIKELAEPVLAHRVILNPDARLRRVDAGEVIRELLKQVPVPISPVGV
jgi:MoxR-like ATPase